ncbi:MAG: hypothetical protein COU81_01675 [Candidatus Portnoybacteria bacterium CG10_big_fil_rev_8_21_14_0_10_36_7]|uniref:DUF4406 domain-containing protein n=1 Tax=Candidatus Portnoybacteria bacterium CG10_big_fil_rev_8_21_14_0_10_36_7 TaxID=1974812 RepID=A0A2M8KEC0_9BACT|nr:MAG: hypothetical protein COU81_01675 [Candidatus Portnoybacteria bacterium CG10_big_fil_rev_8_21_14_0_10_36_7]
MKIFIAGPIAQATYNQLKRFDEMKHYYETQGHEVITEINVPHLQLMNDTQIIADKCQKEPPETAWLIMLMHKIWVMAQCDTLILLPCWRVCPTSVALWIVAKEINMSVLEDKGLVIIDNEDELEDWFHRQIK